MPTYAQVIAARRPTLSDHRPSSTPPDAMHTPTRAKTAEAWPEEKPASSWYAATRNVMYSAIASPYPP